MSHQEPWEYEDILALPHPTSAKHPRMPRLERAAQFAPFAALSGHQAIIDETARVVDQKKELDETKKAYLNDCLCHIQEQIKDQPEVILTYFQQDAYKSGGSYVTKQGRVKKIDTYERQIVMIDGTKIAIDDLYELQAAQEIERFE